MCERFWKKVDKTRGSCWLWTGAVDAYGYGAFSVTVKPKTRKMVKSHRYAYENTIGPIPGGMVIDHLCRNRRCVNPEHLQPVTIKENLIRGDGPRKIGEFHKSKTHCPHGHEYSNKNTYLAKNGQRACRECSRLRTRKKRTSDRMARGVEGTNQK